MRSLGPMMALNPQLLTAARAGSGHAGARTAVFTYGRIGVGARVVAEIVVNVVFGGLGSLQPLWRGQRMLRQSS